MLMEAWKLLKCDTGSYRELAQKSSYSMVDADHGFKSRLGDLQYGGTPPPYLKDSFGSRVPY